MVILYIIITLLIFKIYSLMKKDKGLSITFSKKKKESKKSKEEKPTNKFYKLTLPNYNKDNQVIDHKNKTWAGTALDYVDNEVSFNYRDYDKIFLDVYVNYYNELPDIDKIRYHNMLIDDDKEVLSFIKDCNNFLHKSQKVKKLNETFIPMIKSKKINRTIISSVNHKAYIFVNPYGLYGQDQVNIIDYLKKLSPIFKNKGSDVLMRDFVIHGSLSCLYDVEQRQDIDYIKSFPLAHKDLLDYHFNDDICADNIDLIPDEDIKYKLKIRYNYAKDTLNDKDLNIDDEIQYIDTGDVVFEIDEKDFDQAIILLNLYR